MKAVCKGTLFIFLALVLLWPHYSLASIRGDANLNGQVDMGDVTYIERAILAWIPKTPAMDTNLDGIVNMGDVVQVERIILGIDNFITSK